VKSVNDGPHPTAGELSLRGYARLRGWAPSYVHRLKHEHGLPTTKSGKIDPVVADQWLRDNAIGARNEAVALVNQRRRDRRAASTAPRTRRPDPAPELIPPARLLAAFNAALVAFLRELNPQDVRPD
jgi:hypothetical protein